MFKELMKEMPLSFKLVWAGSAIAGLTLTGFVCWTLYRLVEAFF